MVDTGELENYLNDKSAKRGDKVEILGEGAIEEIPQREGPPRKGLNIPVKCGKRELTWSPGKTAMKPLQTAWGTNTKSWVGMMGEVDFVKQNSYGEIKNILILNPIAKDQKKLK